MNSSFPLWLYGAGYTDLISVIPPGAELAPGSRMQTSSLGKAPGWRLESGKWAGYSWRTHNATRDDINKWVSSGASFGLRADRFPGLDIDVLDVALANEVEALAKEVLGPAPARYGRKPKRLLVYATAAEPISRMRLWLEKDGASHLVELLGGGQQYLVHGIHPVTNEPYSWDTAGFFPAPAGLTPITRAKVEALFSRIFEKYASEFRVYREGDGYARSNAPTDQKSLRSPTIDALQTIVDKLPNDDKHYPGRDAYIRVGYAIRAAAGDAVEEGYEVFASWAARHAKDGRVSGNPATWREDYNRMKPPFALGWQWLRDEAHRCGHNTAQEDFGAVFPTPAPEQDTLAQAQQNTPGKLPNGDDPGHSLGELLEHSELTEMPPELVPNIAWQGLKTLFSGREKTGKSTLILSGIAAATRGDDFLGSGTSPRTVVWLTEEALRLTVRRAHAMRADPDRLKIVSMGKDPPMQLAQKPYLVQFDSVTQRGAALVLVIHALKAHEDGRYRGSSALGAWVDVIAEMKNPQAESSVRDIACKGRVDADSFSVRYDNGEFRLLSSEQKQSSKQDARERELVGWVTSGALRGKKYKAAELEAIAVQGLVVKDGGVWRATTADEQAQIAMGQ